MDYFNLTKAKLRSGINIQHQNAVQTQDNGRGLIKRANNVALTSSSAAVPYGSKGKLGVLDYYLADTTLSKNYYDQDTINISSLDDRYNVEKGSKYVAAKFNKHDDGLPLKPYMFGLLISLVHSALTLGDIVEDIESAQSGIPKFIAMLTKYIHMNVSLCLLNNVEFIVDWYLCKLMQRTIPSPNDKALVTVALNALKGMLYHILEHSCSAEAKIKLLHTILMRLVLEQGGRGENAKSDAFYDFFGNVLKTITNIYGDTQYTKELLTGELFSTSNIVQPEKGTGTFIDDISMFSNSKIHQYNNMVFNITEETIQCTQVIGETLKLLNTFLKTNTVQKLKPDTQAIILLCVRRLALIYNYSLHKMSREATIHTSADASAETLNVPGVTIKKIVSEDNDADNSDQATDEVKITNEADGEASMKNELKENNCSSDVDDNPKENISLGEEPACGELIDILKFVHPALVLPDISLLKVSHSKLIDREFMRKALTSRFEINKQLEKKTKSVSSGDKILITYAADTLSNIFNRENDIDEYGCLFFVVLLTYAPQILVTIFFYITASSSVRSFSVIQQMVNALQSIYARYLSDEYCDKDGLKQEMNKLIDEKMLQILNNVSSNYSNDIVYVINRNRMINVNRQNNAMELQRKDNAKVLKSSQNKNKIQRIYLNFIRRSSKLRGRCICYTLALRSEDVLKSFNISSGKWLRAVADSFKMSEECLFHSSDDENVILDADLIVYKRSAFKTEALTAPFLVENREFFRNYRGNVKYYGESVVRRLINFKKYITGIEAPLLHPVNKGDTGESDTGEHSVDECEETECVNADTCTESMSDGQLYGFLVDCMDSSDTRFYGQFVRRLTYYYIEDALNIIPYEIEKLMVKDLVPPESLPYMAMNVDIAAGAGQKQPGLCLVSNEEITIASHLNVIPMDVKDGIEHILSEKCSSNQDRITVVFDRPLKSVANVTSEELSSVLGILGTAANATTSSDMIGGKTSDNVMARFGDFQSSITNNSNVMGSDWVYSVVPPDWSIIARARETSFGAYNTAKSNMPPYAMHRSYNLQDVEQDIVSLDPHKQRLDFLYNNKTDAQLPHSSIYNASSSNSVVVLGYRNFVEGSVSPSGFGKHSYHSDIQNEGGSPVSFNSQDGTSPRMSTSGTSQSLLPVDSTPISTDGSLLFHPFNIPDIAFQHVYAPIMQENIFTNRSKKLQERANEEGNRTKDRSINGTKPYGIVNLEDKSSLIKKLSETPITIMVGQNQAISLTVNGKAISTDYNLKAAHSGIGMFLLKLSRCYGDVRASHIACSTLTNLRRINMHHRPTGIEIGMSTPYTTELIKIDSRQGVAKDREDTVFRRLAFDSELCHVFRNSGASEIILSLPDKYNSTNHLIMTYIRHCIESIAKEGDASNGIDPFTYKMAYYDIPAYAARELLYTFLGKSASKIKTGLIAACMGKQGGTNPEFRTELINPIIQESQDSPEIMTLLKTSVPNLEYTSNTTFLKAVVNRTNLTSILPTFSGTIPTEVTALYVLSYLYFGTPSILLSSKKNLQYINELTCANISETDNQNINKQIVRLVNKGTLNGITGARAFVDSWRSRPMDKYNSMSEGAESISVSGTAGRSLQELKGTRKYKNRNITAALSLQRLWACGLISTFEFINYLNVLAARYSACEGSGDPTTCTVFPWILNDFRTEKFLELSECLREDAHSSSPSQLQRSLLDSPLLSDRIHFIKRKIRASKESQEPVSIENKEQKNKDEILFINEESRYQHMFRDLSYPMGAQTEKDRMKAQSKFEFAHEQYLRSLTYKDKRKHQFPPFHYGTFYSTPSSNQLYLLPLSPNIENHIALQSFNFDYADRQFTTIMKYQSASDGRKWGAPIINPNDNLELIAEMFYLDFPLRNPYNNGVRYNRSRWMERDLRNADKSIERANNGLFALSPFILESVYVKKRVMEWVDLVFGRNTNTCFFSRDKEEEEKRNGAISRLNTFFHNAYPVPNIETLYESVVLQEANDKNPRVYMQTNQISTKAQAMEQREFFGSSPSQLFTRDDSDALNNSYKNNVKIDVMKSVSIVDCIECKRLDFHREAIIGERPIRSILIDTTIPISQLQQLYSATSSGMYKDSYEIMTHMEEIVYNDVDFFVDNSAAKALCNMETVIIPLTDMTISLEFIGDGYVKVNEVERRLLTQKIEYDSTSQLSTGSLGGNRNIGSIGPFGTEIVSNSSDSTHTIGIFDLGCSDSCTKPIQLLGSNVIAVLCSNGVIKFFSLRTNRDIDMSNKKSIGMHETSVESASKSLVSQPTIKLKQSRTARKLLKLDEHSFMNSSMSFGISSLPTYSKMTGISSNKGQRIDIMQLDIPLSPMEIMTRTTGTKNYFINLQRTVKTLCADILPIASLPNILTGTSSHSRGQGCNSMFIMEVGSIQPRIGPNGCVLPTCMAYNNSVDMAVVAYNDGTIYYLINNNIFKTTNLFYLLRFNGINPRADECLKEITLVDAEQHVPFRSIHLFDDCRLLVLLSEDNIRFTMVLISPSNIVESIWNVNLCGNEGLLSQISSASEWEGPTTVVGDPLIMSQKSSFSSIMIAFNIQFNNGQRGGVAFVELEIVNLKEGWSPAQGTLSDARLKRFQELEASRGTITTMAYDQNIPWLLLVGTSGGTVYGFSLPPVTRIPALGPHSCAKCGCAGFDCTSETPYDMVECAGYRTSRGKPLLRIVAPYKGLFQGILMCQECIDDLEREKHGLPRIIHDEDSSDEEAIKFLEADELTYSSSTPTGTEPKSDESDEDGGNVGEEKTCTAEAASDIVDASSNLDEEQKSNEDEGQEARMATIESIMLVKEPEPDRPESEEEDDGEEDDNEGVLSD